MRDTDRDTADPGAPPRPAREDEHPGAGLPAARRRPERVPVAGRHEDDGLWEHVIEIGGGVAFATWLLAVFLPRAVPLWQVSTAYGAVTAATWWAAVSLTASAAVAAYLASWGIFLTAWVTVARLAGPWHETVTFALVLPLLVLVPAGVTVIRRHRDRTRRTAELGRDNASIRACRYWEEFLGRLGARGVSVRDVIREEGGYAVHGRLGRFVNGERPAGMEAVRELAVLIAQHKRLPKGAVYIEEAPAGMTSADFVIHVKTADGPRLAKFLPAENSLLSITRPFGLGMFDTGREFCLKLSEVVVFIAGLRGSGKSTLLNVLTAQLARMPDALVFWIDLKGGQEARAWLMPWILGQVDEPPIHWLATDSQEAKIMLDALWEGGKARAESGLYGKKLRPRPDRPAIIVICDETAVMTGHRISEDSIRNSDLSRRLVQIAETFRSVAIDPVVAAVRAVVDITGNSGLKAMSDVRSGMKVASAEEGRMIFPDDLPAARQLAQLKDRGMGITKTGGTLYPPVHFYNITDGELDDEGKPTEDRITPIVLATADRRTRPEQLVQDAMNTVRITIGDQDRGAYEARWDQPHVAGLISQWRQNAPQAAVPQLPAPRPGGGNDDIRRAFDDLVQADPELAGLDLIPDDGTRRLAPARKRMRQLLIDRGSAGYQSGKLRDQLAIEGHTVTRETVCRWLADDEERGYVFRTGKPRSRWVWRLRAGQEYDLPGMDFE